MAVATGLTGPVYAGILTGGQSRRFGRPKEELRRGGRLLVDELASALSTVAAGVYLLGRAVKGSHLPAIADPPGLAGPLAGMVAAFRWAPQAAWLFASCDLPGVRAEGVRWLAAQRAPERWAVVPTVAGGPQPLLAIYEPPARALIEALAGSGHEGPRSLAEHVRVYSPEPPFELATCWQDVDTPDQLTPWPDIE